MLQRSSYYPGEGMSSAPPGQAVAGISQSNGRAAPVPMLEVSIQRLEEILDQETAALKTRQAIDLKVFNDRKSQALLELTRWLRNVQNASASPELSERVLRLKEKLAINQTVLKLHLEAVREISTSLADAIRQSESDGTYTQAISSIARQP